MKSLDLNAYGVSEMNQQEMLIVDGGNILKDAANAIKTAAEAVAEAAKTAYEWAKEHVTVSVIPSGYTKST
jgi:hypothetical protein